MSLGGRALTGAWIETLAFSPRQQKLPECRALTGAWIETKNYLCCAYSKRRSRPHGRVD